MRLRCEAGDRPQPVRHLLVLTRLELRFEAIDGNLDADDGARHLLDVRGRRVGDAPWCLLPGLVPIRQSLQHVPLPLGIFHGMGDAMRMDHGVVPGGHDLSVRLLARVPAGRDVGLRSLEDHDRRRFAIERAPDVIGAGHVADQRAERPPVAIEDEGNVVGCQTPLAGTDPGAQRIRLHQREDGLAVRQCMVSGNVHVEVRLKWTPSGDRCAGARDR